MQNNQFEGGTACDGTNNMETTRDPVAAETARNTEAQAVDQQRLVTRWPRWSKENLEKEIKDRMVHFYGQADGSIKFPNTAEGDLLKIVEALLSANAEVSNTEGAKRS